MQRLKWCTAGKAGIVRAYGWHRVLARSTERKRVSWTVAGSNGAAMIQVPGSHNQGDTTSASVTASGRSGS